MPPATASTRQLVSLQAAADHLDVTVRTVRRQISGGVFKAYRVGPRLLRVDLAEVDAALVAIPTVTPGA